MKPRFITKVDFCHKYDVTSSAIAQAGYRTNKLHFQGNKINESYFLQRRAQKEKIRTKVQDLYYYLSEFYTLTEISRMMDAEKYASYFDFFNYHLFQNEEETLIINTQVSSRLLKAYRFWWRLERILKRDGFSIEMLLDKRAEKDYIEKISLSDIIKKMQDWELDNYEKIIDISVINHNKKTVLYNMITKEKNDRARAFINHFKH